MTTIAKRSGAAPKREWPGVTQLVVVNLYVAISLLAPTIVGLWADARASREFPFFTVLGLAAGTAIMIWGVYRMLRPYVRRLMGAES